MGCVERDSARIRPLAQPRAREQTKTLHSSSYYPTHTSDIHFFRQQQPFASHSDHSCLVYSATPLAPLVCLFRLTALTGRGGRGRGAHYKAKYGGGRGTAHANSRANGADEAASARDSNDGVNHGNTGTSDWDSLQRDLRSIDGQPYGKRKHGFFSPTVSFSEWARASQQSAASCALIQHVFLGDRSSVLP